MKIITEKKPKKDPLTLKQRIFVDEYLANGGNATKAIAKAHKLTTPKGMTYSSRRSTGSRMLNSPLVSREIERRVKSMREIFDERGATDEFIAEVFIDGAKNAKKYFISGGKLAAVPDAAERRQNAKEIAQIKDLYPNTKVDLTANVKTESVGIQQIADLLQQIYREKNGKRSIEPDNQDIDSQSIPQLQG